MPPPRAMNHGASSSSSRSPNSNGHDNANPYDNSPYAHDDNGQDELDLLGDDTHHPADDDATLLRDDPLQTDLSSPLTFKRKHKQPSLLSHPARLITAFTSGRARNHNNNNNNHTQNNDPPDAGPSTHLDPLPSTTNPQQQQQHHHHPKSEPFLPTDWTTSTPGRRVAYADLTAIDWIFEYTKERQRQRALRSSHLNNSSLRFPLLGYVQRLLDASQVWVVLICSGLAVGALAAGIDVATDWLGDVKYGYCSGVDGGRFYLGKTACCLGYDAGSMCRGWRRWGEVFGAGGSKGGMWVVEGAVYLVMAVGFFFPCVLRGKGGGRKADWKCDAGYVSACRGSVGQGVCRVCQA